MIKNLSAVAKALENAVSEFTDLAVVGISGGVDSSLVASICVRALGKEQVHLVSMPYDQNDLDTFNARSKRWAEHLGAKHHVLSISAASDQIEQVLKQAFSDQALGLLVKANVRPRVRMSLLYGIAAQLGLNTAKRVRVIGTGHLSEDLIGYDTKGGDALCDIFILAELVKSEVYQLAEYYGISAEIIKAPPSAGLYPGQTDEKELGYSYAELEDATLALFRIITGKGKLDLSNSEFAGIKPEYSRFVLERYLANAHKHQAPVNVRVRNGQWFY